MALADYLFPISTGRHADHTGSHTDHTALHAAHKSRNRGGGRSPNKPTWAWPTPRSPGSGLSGVAEELSAGQSEQPPLVLIR
jgi:hypothetical protein